MNSCQHDEDMAALGCLFAGGLLAFIVWLIVVCYEACS